MATINGEVWFKMDRAPQDGFEFVNQIKLNRQQVARRLATAAALCPTWVQTCMFALDGVLPDAAALEEFAVLAFVIYGALTRGEALPAPAIGTMPDDAEDEA